MKMLKQFGLLILVLGVTVSANAAIQVSPDTAGYEAYLPHVAACGDSYFVVWREDGAGYDSLWGAFVARDLSGLRRVGLHFVPGPDSIQAIAVASKGDTVLVVYQELTGPAPGIWAIAVTSAGSTSPTRVSYAGPPPPGCSVPAVAACADSFLVVFLDASGSACGRGILGNGEAASATPFEVLENVAMPSLASDGTDFLMVYLDESDYTCGIRVHDEEGFSISGSAACDVAEVTYDPLGEKFLVAFITSDDTLRSALCTLNGDVSDPVTVRGSVNEDNIAAAPCSINCMVVWEREVSQVIQPHYVAGRRFNSAGELVGPEDSIPQVNPVNIDPDIAAIGTDYGIVWRDDDEDAVLIDILSGFQRHFYAHGLCATAYNNGRHLALDPETGWLHRVYQTGGGQGDSILYTWSADGGLNWFPFEVVGVQQSGSGAFPCIVCEDQENNGVWFCFRVDDDYDSVKVRLGTGDWAGFRIECPSSGTQEQRAPTMSIAYAESQGGPGVYVANRTDEDGVQRIVCHKVRLELNPVAETVAVADEGVICYQPSLATSPYDENDIIHCVWSVFDGADERYYLWYNQSIQGSWQSPEVASDERVSTNNHPSADVYGDSFYVAWEAPEFWDVAIRARRIDEAQAWGDQDYLSQTPSLPSRYPQNSLGRVSVAWRETPRSAQDPEFWLYVDDGIEVLREAENVADYIHIASALTSTPGLELSTYATWTEALNLVSSLYEVMFTHEYYSLGTFDGGPDIAYYDCHVGDSSQSRYCVARDGRALWRGRGVDYARDRLAYRLPYLNPHCIYKVRAVLFQSSNSTWEQSLAFDNRPAGRVSYRPEVPETAWVTIPRELYRKDCSVDLDIDRIAGDYASVAQLRLYEVYPFLADRGDEVYLPVAEPAERLLVVAGGNPFRSQAQVRYNVPVAQQVAVRVYDTQGRAVRELASGPHRAGAYSLSWNGTDSRGRRVAAGTYFIELKTETAGTTGKVVYAP